MFEQMENGTGKWTKQIKICGVFDHSVIDGAKGAKFMQKIEEYLTHPYKPLIQ